MGIRTIIGTTGASSVAVLYDSVTDQALGPIFFDPEEPFDFGDQDDISDAEGVAQAFLEYLATEGIRDARQLTYAELHDQFDAFHRFIDSSDLGPRKRPEDRNADATARKR